MTSKRTKQARRQQAVARTVQAQAQAHGQIQEIIGRTAPLTQVTATGLYAKPTIDATRPDYAFWDGIRHGTKPDYLLGGLFADAIASILSSWIFGKGFNASIVPSQLEGDYDAKTIEATNTEITCFINEHGAACQRAITESLALGDSYLIPNADGTLTTPSPAEVEILTTPKGSLAVTGYELTTTLDAMTVKDRYELDIRTYTVQAGGLKTAAQYRNLIGMIPVVHVPTKRATNELYGRPCYARLRPLFARYDKVLNKAADGAELLGNPKPSIYGVEEPQKTIEAMASSKTVSVDPATGAQVTRYNVDFNGIPFIVVGKGGRFEFVGPATGFTGDSVKVLEILFLLMLQYSGVPEWAWGGAISSSKASVDSQLPAFVMLIERLRMEIAPKLAQAIEIHLAYKALYTPNIIVAKPAVDFAPVITEDREVMLDYIDFLHSRNLVRDETAVALTGLVNDPAAEVAGAKKEAADDNPDRMIDEAIDLALLGGDDDRTAPPAERRSAADSSSPASAAA